jgi:hypothetical protein
MVALGLLGARAQPYGAAAPETLWNQLRTVVRVVIGDAAWMQGDVYLHRGIRDDEARDNYNLFLAYNPYKLFVHQDHDDIACGRTHDAAEGDAHDEPHVHMQRQHESELLPLFWLTAKADPHNIKNWTVGSYWIERVGNTNAAVRFLEEGLRYNPRDPLLQLDLGVILFRRNTADDAWRSVPLLWRALGGLTAPQDRRRAYTYLGATLHTSGATGAVAALRQRWLAEFGTNMVPAPLQDAAPRAD